MSHSLRVFVSTTSKDLGTARREVAGVLRTLGITAVTQEDFPPDYRTIRGMLEAKIKGCAALVHVAGFYCGGEPKPPCDPRRSYTQLELDIADELGIPAFVFLADEKFPFDEHGRETDDGKKQCQLDHRKRLEARAGKYERVADLWQLCYRVAVTPFPGLKRFADPHKWQNLPVASLGSLFKGRDEFLVTLWQTLQAKPTAAVVAKQAIHGLGGVGKTRLAIEFAHRFADHYAALLFVTADSEASLRRNLAALCGVLNLPERAAREEQVQVDAVVREFATNPGWLLILDNADAPEAAKAVRAMLPQLQGGHVLITSRRDDWDDGAIETLKLDVLSIPSATDFLLERTHKKRVKLPTDAADAAALAKELGGLAIALEQAAAFIAADRTLSIADYLARWRKLDAELVGWSDDITHPRSLAVTWQSTWAVLGGDARALLNLLAWLGEAPIPLVMLTPSPKGERDITTTLNFDAARRDLLRYSMIEAENVGMDISVHPLVQDVLRIRMRGKEKKRWIEAALGMVNRFVPDTLESGHSWLESWPDLSVTRPHADAITQSAEAIGIGYPTSRLLGQIAAHCWKIEAYEMAEPYMRRALTIDESLYGPDHPSVAIRIGNLALLLETAGRQAEAEPLMRRALAIDEANYGTDHPKVAYDLDNLARLLRDTNRLPEAVPLMRRAFEIRSKSHRLNCPSRQDTVGTIATYILFFDLICLIIPSFIRIINFLNS